MLVEYPDPKCTLDSSGKACHSAVPSNCIHRAIGLVKKLQEQAEAQLKIELKFQSDMNYLGIIQVTEHVYKCKTQHRVLAVYKKAAWFSSCSIPGLCAGTATQPCTPGLKRQAKIQAVFQLDEAAYSLETGQHQWIHKNANGFLGKLRMCPGAAWWQGELLLNQKHFPLSFHLQQDRQHDSHSGTKGFQSNKETHLHLLGCKTYPEWRGSRSMPHYPRERTEWRSDSWRIHHQHCRGHRDLGERN